MVDHGVQPDKKGNKSEKCGLGTQGRVPETAGFRSRKWEVVVREDD